MKKTALLIILALLLMGCNDRQQIITTYKWMIVTPSIEMYYCPVLTKFPNWKTLKDSEVAEIIKILHKNNLTCKSSIESIRKYLKEANVKMGGN